MKVNEIFESIQGEGRYVGRPVQFIRLSGCTRNCDFCDTHYHSQFEEIPKEKLAHIIEQSMHNTIIWTGGEPMLQYPDIEWIIKYTSKSKEHHLESNGDVNESYKIFNYVCISPKSIESAAKFHKHLYFLHHDFDIKVVTDLERVNKELITFATMLQPLTTGDPEQDKIISRKVWEYCIKKNLYFSPRIHVAVWGLSKGR